MSDAGVTYRTLGASGLKVSPVCLGTGGYGTSTPPDQAARMLDAFLDLGHNFVDTADMYGDGESERTLGRLLATRRDRVVLATKARGTMGPGPNDAGLSRAHLTRALDASLRRLGTDHVDLYQCHFPDLDTPIDETMATLDGFVRAGKVRYIGCSNFQGSQIVEAQWAAARANGTPFVSLQSEYSLINRTIETDILRAAQRHGLGVMAYSPIGGGVLTGKYRGGELPAESRYATVSTTEGADRSRAAMLAPSSLEIADAVSAIAADLGLPASVLAVAWVRGRRGVTSVLIGPRTFEQFEQYLPGLELELDRATIRRLDEVSRR